MHWLFKCDCGNEKTIWVAAVKSGNTKSCGCWQKDNPVNLSHGMSDTRFYQTWKSMKRRCYGKNTNAYCDYGGRGIKVEWQSFEEFRGDMYGSYLEHVAKYGERNTTIERMNNDGNYSKENCRWATQKEQVMSTRHNRYFTYKGKIMVMKDFAREYNVSYPTLAHRLDRGMTIGEALFGNKNISKVKKI